METIREQFTDLSCCYYCESEEELQDAYLDDGYRRTKIKLCKECYKEVNENE